MLQQQSDGQMGHADSHKSKEKIKHKKIIDSAGQLYNIRKKKTGAFIKNNLLRFKEMS